MHWIAFALVLPAQRAQRLLSIIQRIPGLHTSELSREAGQPRGTVQYHLRLLEQSGLVARVEAAGVGRFYPAGIEDERLRLLALLHGRRREIEAFVRDRPGLRQVDICRALEVSRKTFRASIGPLMEAGLVQERRGLQTNRYYPGPGEAAPAEADGAAGAQRG